jgi:hypothetical protein
MDGIAPWSAGTGVGVGAACSRAGALAGAGCFLDRLARFVAGFAGPALAAASGAALPAVAFAARATGRFSVAG